MNEMPHPPSSLKALGHGFMLHCPRCGHGNLFHSYIKQNSICPNCQEYLADLRADDAPPWLTILITGHIIVPLLIVIEQYKLMEFWTEIIVMVSAALLCCFLILPRAKGLFIACLWLIREKKNDIPA